MGKLKAAYALLVKYLPIIRKVVDYTKELLKKEPKNEVK